MHKGLRMAGKRAGIRGIPATQLCIMTSPPTFRFGSYWPCDTGLVASLA